MQKTLVILAALVSISAASAQMTHPAPFGDFLRGFQKSVHGETIDYHSAEPDVGQALLVRAVDSRRSIAWETTAVPKELRGKSVTFAWMFGMAARPDSRSFEFLVDGVRRITFENPERAEIGQWNVAGTDGAELCFRTTLVDKHEDVFGYAALTLPARDVTPGKALRLEVRGESAGSSNDNGLARSASFAT